MAVGKIQKATGRREDTVQPMEWLQEPLSLLPVAVSTKPESMVPCLLMSLCITYYLMYLSQDQSETEMY